LAASCKSIWHCKPLREKPNSHLLGTARKLAGYLLPMDAALDDVFVDEISFPATDGYALSGTLFLPRGTKRHAVLINSATAVPRKIYRGFASYLAHRGCAVLTYDYRGIGDSRLPAMVGYNQPKSLVGFKASMSDWAALDVTAAVHWMRALPHPSPGLCRPLLRRPGARADREQRGHLARRVCGLAGGHLAADDVAGKIPGLRLHEFCRSAARPRARLRAGLGRHRRGFAQGRFPAMGRVGLEPALSLRFKAAGAGEFCQNSRASCAHSASPTTRGRRGPPSNCLRAGSPRSSQRW
jgi:hypothetical protein